MGTRTGSSSLYPAGNLPCEGVSSSYVDHLADTTSFQRLTLEAFVEAVRLVPGQDWIELFHDRYLAFD